MADKNYPGRPADHSFLSVSRNGFAAGTLNAKPDYTVKESPRAKHVRLTLSLQDGLVVVVPKGFDQRRIPPLLQKKKRWIENASERIDEQRKLLESEPLGGLPERMALRGISEEWTIELRPTKSPQTRIVERPGHHLLLSGDTANIRVCRAALRRWLNRKAHEQIKPRLVRLAEEHGFKLGRILVRSQRTRWGSCSRRKTVSLNLKLLFIPQDLAQYVLIHELCHTVHLNHSKKFWALLNHHEPDCARKEKALRSAGRFVPAWIDAKKSRSLNGSSWE
jgi:predicted metal-dependent hydrolase